MDAIVSELLPWNCIHPRFLLYPVHRHTLYNIAVLPILAEKNNREVIDLMPILGTLTDDCVAFGFGLPFES